MSKSLRTEFTERKIPLFNQRQVDMASALLANLPIDEEKPLEMVVREQVKPRKLSQNAAMWAGVLFDISEQAYVQGRTYSADVWHEHFKEAYLPEDFDEKLTKAGYRKYDFTPSGRRVLVGSTEQLTVKGFALYMTQIEAFGANLGVMFHVNPNDIRGRA